MMEPLYKYSDRDWKRIYRFLQRGYWHRTFPNQWAEIKKSGMISPNKDGRFPLSFNTTLEDERSYGVRNGYVCLFDFVTASERQVIEYWEHAWSIICDDRQATVLLRLDRRKLKPKIIEDADATRKGFLCVPHVEVWYPTNIPISAISECYRVPLSNGGEFNPESVSMDDVIKSVHRPPRDWFSNTGREADANDVKPEA